VAVRPVSVRPLPQRHGPTPRPDKGNPCLPLHAEKVEIVPAGEVGHDECVQPSSQPRWVAALGKADRNRSTRTNPHGDRCRSGRSRSPHPSRTKEDKYRWDNDGQPKTAMQLSASPRDSSHVSRRSLGPGALQLRGHRIQSSECQVLLKRSPQDLAQRTRGAFWASDRSNSATHHGAVNAHSPYTYARFPDVV